MSEPKNSTVDVSVRSADFDAGVEIDKLRRAGVGAIATFIGIVRDNAETPGLIAMTLEHFPGMKNRKFRTLLIRLVAAGP